MNQYQKMINENSLADIEFRVKWKSPDATHTDTTLVMVNFWRDILPETVSDGLMGIGEGEQRIFLFSPGQLVPANSDRQQYHLKRSDFNEKMAAPAFGRFYPKGILQGLPNVFPQNMAPVRCVGVDSKTITVDMNHPLATHALEVTAKVHKIYDKPFDRGGNCRELGESIADGGPGMQARYNATATDFFRPGAFAREDEAADSRFYERPRLVTHIDERAIETISGLYGEIITPGMVVLDLMSSWRSHLPETAKPCKLIGLGMNAKELHENPQIDESVVHDLNQNPRLPFDDNAFDSVICTASVEYLTNPAAVFADTARILKPGGMLIHTFSNRWFPPKAIRLWT
ncbi:MAG: methyltransferase domain-containing protein, partial [Thermodesulfobacteriota bacterium]